MTIELDFKQALRIDMERKGWSEAALGKALGISQQAVHKWLERGFPPLARLNDLLAVLGEGSEVSKLEHKAIYGGRSRSPRLYFIVENENPDHKFKVKPPSNPDESSGSGSASENSSKIVEAWNARYKSLLSSSLENSRIVWNEFKEALPGELHCNLDRRVQNKHGSLEVDYASDRVVAEIVSVKSSAASHNISAKILQILTYAQMQNPDSIKLLLVATDSAELKLNNVASLATKAFDVHIKYVENGKEAAKIITDIESHLVGEILEPDE